MQILARNHGYYFDEYHRTYPPDFHPAAGFSQAVTHLADSVSQGTISEVCFQGVCIQHSQFTTNRADTIQTYYDFPAVEMHFSFQGKGGPAVGHSHLPYHTLCFRPATTNRQSIDSGSHDALTIQLTIPFLSRFATDESPTLGRLLDGMGANRVACGSSVGLPIPPAMQVQVRRLIPLASACQSLQRLYLETTVLELLFQQLRQFDSQPAKTADSLKPQDVEKVWAVKLLLEADPLATYSLHSLARRVGLNEFKLKKGFRDLFGTTVFGLLTDLRMNYARRVLRDTSQPVSLIADALGYSEPYHFSAAYKRHFGCLPRDERT